MNRIESYPCRVKGVTFYNEKYGNREYRQTIIDDLYHKKMLENGQLLRLKQEPDNEIDPFAVAVFGPDGRQLGYVPRDDGLAKNIFGHISEGHYCKASVDHISGGANSVTMDIYINIDVFDGQPFEKPDYLKEIVNNKIVRLEVEGLFGLYDYDLRLKQDISILYGMNGRGKSTLMRMIRDVVGGTAKEAFEVPFRRFALELSNGAVISLVNGDSGQMRIIDFDQPIPGKTSHAVFMADNEDWRDCLNNCLEGMRVHLIPADRLYEHSQSFGGTGRISKCRRMIRSDVARSKNSFLRNSETLETSFPYRAVADMEKGTEYMDGPTINKEMHRLEDRREDYKKVGLLQQRERHQFEKPFEISKDASPDLLRMMSLYIRDCWAKYSVCDGVYQRLSLLEEIINVEHQYLNKKLVYDFGDEEDPVRFELPDGKILTLEQLSSGEKNDFILFSELIFGSFANTVILIDEPEISLHVAWQMTIMDELIRIAELNHFQVVVATHSPSIVGDHWDMSIGLGEDEDDE